MDNLTEDVFIISSIASCIAADNFTVLESTIKYAKPFKIDEKIYETILQCYLFCGFPATLESLKIFKKHFPRFHKSKLKYDSLKFKNIGVTNCKLIYKKNYKKLIDNINYMSPDLQEWMLIEGYGKVLGRDGLSLLEREFINVSILCTRYYENQLHSHIKGCLNLGASKKDIEKLLIKIKSIAGSKNINKSLNLLMHIIE